MKPIQNDLAAALGFDLEHADLNSRILAHSTLGVIAVVAWALLDNGTVTVAQLQASIAAARNPAVNTWPQEPASVPYGT
jgi:hypothetical protein